MATSETLRSVIDAGRTSRRLDELSAARVIGKIAQQVHAAQQKAGAGKAVGPVSPSAVVLATTGEASLALPAPGPLGYTAPEQLDGGAGDRRSDVFSLGVVMWEALTHQRLFEAMNDAAVKAAIAERAIRPPAEINANIPAELSAICMRALARSPADRYQSAKSMSVEIEEFLEEAGYADSDGAIAEFLADLGKPRAEKKVTLPPPTRSAEPAAGALPSVLTAPTQPPSVLASAPAVAPSSPGAALASALASAGTPPASSAPADKTTTAPGLGPSVLVAPAPAANARTANGTAPPPLVPMPPILPSATLAGTGAPSRAEVEAAAAKAEAAKTEAAKSEAAKSEAAKTEAARTEAARADAAKAEAARANAAKADAAKADAARADAARADAAKAEAAKADAAKADAAKTDPARADAAKAPSSQTVLGLGAMTHTPGPATAEATRSAPGAAATARPDDAALAAPIASTGSRPSRAATSPGAPHPASVVALPQGKDKDVLAGWGWGTDSHQAITDDSDLDLPAGTTNNRKLLLYLFGGGIAFTALVAIIAFGFGGSTKKPAPPRAARTQEWNQIGSATPDTAGSSAVGSDVAAGSDGTAGSDLAVGSAAATAEGSAATGAADSTEAALAATGSDAAAGSASAMVAATRPAAPAPTPPEPAPTKPAPTPTAPPTPKVAAAKPTARTETPSRPAKPTPTKPAKSSRPAKTTKTTRGPTGTPVDPYGETRSAKPARSTASKADVEKAYRTGLQQFARGDTTGALASLRTSLAGNPSYAPTWRALGLVFEKLGEKDQARAAYKRYLQLAPSAGDAGQIRSRLERLGS